MTRQWLRGCGLSVAGVFACAVIAMPAAAQSPPGFSPMDKTRIDKSGQNTNLKGHPVPSTVTPVEIGRASCRERV